MGGYLTDTGAGIAVHAASGSTIMTGQFRDTMVVGATTLASAGGVDAWVARLDASGLAQWAVSLGGASNDNGLGVAVSGAGEAVVVGSTILPAMFGSINLTSSSPGSADGEQSEGRAGRGSLGASGPAPAPVGGSRSRPQAPRPRAAYAAKLSASGAVLWATSIGGVSSDLARAAAIDAAGSVYVAGLFRNSVTVATTSGNVTLTSAGNTDTFVMKLAGATGAVLWARRFGGTDADEPSAGALALGPSGASLYVGGSFKSASMAVGNTTLAAAAGFNGYVACLNTTSGAPLWAANLGGGGGDENINALAYNSSGAPGTPAAYALSAQGQHGCGGVANSQGGPMPAERPPGCVATQHRLPTAVSRAPLPATAAGLFVAGSFGSSSGTGWFALGSQNLTSAGGKDGAHTELGGGSGGSWGQGRRGMHSSAHARHLTPTPLPSTRPPPTQPGSPSWTPPPGRRCGPRDWAARKTTRPKRWPSPPLATSSWGAPSRCVWAARAHMRARQGACSTGGPRARCHRRARPPPRRPPPHQLRPTRQGTTTGFANLTAAAAATADVFTARLGEASGSAVWATRLGGSDFESVGGLAVSQANGVEVLGTFQDSMLVGATNLTAVGSSDAFVAALNVTTGAPNPL